MAAAPDIREPVMRATLFLVGLLVCGVGSVPAAFAQAQEPTVPEQAQAPFRKGLAAAGQQEWALAVKYFGEAQAAAPSAPEILFNLALAYDKLGGRELMALAWFHAYLAAAPQADNVQPVRHRMTELEVKVEATVQKLFAQALEAASALPLDEGDEGLPDKAVRAYEAIAREQWLLGDLAGARATCGRALEAIHRYHAEHLRNPQLQRDDPEYPEMVASRRRIAFWYSIIARSQIQMGDVEGAKATRAALDALSGGRKDDVEGIVHTGEDLDAGIAWALAKRGDTQAAEALADRIPSIPIIETRSRAYAAITQALIERGDFSAAKKAMGLAGNDVMTQSGLNESFAKAQAKAGDVAGALASAAKMEPPYDPRWVYEEIARVQAGAKDIAGALTTAKRIADPKGRCDTYATIVTAQAEGGDVAGAERTSAGVASERCEGLYAPRETLERWKYLRKVEAEKTPAQRARELTTEEINSWMSLIHGYDFNQPQLQDVQGFLASLRALPPTEVPSKIAEAAWMIAHTLATFKEKEAEWRQRRASAAH